jgi:hypothetical protein
MWHARELSLGEIKREGGAEHARTDSARERAGIPVVRQGNSQ